MPSTSVSEQVHSLLLAALEHQDWSALQRGERLASQAIEATPGAEPPRSERDIKRVQLLSGFRQLPTDKQWWPERLALLREAQQWLQGA